jgi:uncharacterized membrane-anchored protein YjiN (DUF445 family)
MRNEIIKQRQRIHVEALKLEDASRKHNEVMCTLMDYLNERDDVTTRNTRAADRLWKATSALSDQVHVLTNLIENYRHDTMADRKQIKRQIRAAKHMRVDQRHNLFLDYCVLYQIRLRNEPEISEYAYRTMQLTVDEELGAHKQVLDSLACRVTVVPVTEESDDIPSDQVWHFNL